MALDPTKVPKEVRSLLPLAERWHIGDDYDREAAVSTASLTELRELVGALEGKNGDSVYEWLAGPESFSQSPSDEYLALTHMTMAADSAKIKLKRNEQTA